LVRAERRGSNTHSSINVRPVDTSLLVSVDPEPPVDSDESSGGLATSRNGEVGREEVLDSSEERIDHLRRSEEDEVVREDLRNCDEEEERRVSGGNGKEDEGREGEREKVRGRERRDSPSSTPPHFHPQAYPRSSPHSHSSRPDRYIRIWQENKAVPSVSLDASKTKEHDLDLRSFLETHFESTSVMSIAPGTPGT